MDIKEILEICVYALALISTLAGLIASKTKNAKLSNVAKVTKKMQELCEDAEKLNPENKKQYVLLGIEQFCDLIKYEYDEDYWSKAIDVFIDFTKKINAKK